MQPMQQQPFQGTQSPMPYYPQHSMQPQQFQPTQSPMPYYPQQQPTTQIPHQQMPMQQPYPDMKNDYCGPGQPIMYGPNGQMMPIQQYQQQQPPFMNGYNESDDYDD
jgi:morphogenetic protein associated with SpoVID